MLFDHADGFNLTMFKMSPMFVGRYMESVAVYVDIMTYHNHFGRFQNKTLAGPSSTSWCPLTKTENTQMNFS